MCICLNTPYWEFANEMLWGLNTFFLKHPSIKDKYDVQLLLWADIPEDTKEITNKMIEYLANRKEIPSSIINETQIEYTIKEENRQFVNDCIQKIVNIRDRGAKIFPTEPVEWPLPTLLRYHLFLQQEEELQKFDYVFYIDVDMRITDWIGEEIFGEGLTAAQHPMYALRHNYNAPYEPNPESTAHIKLPGRIIEDNGKKVFQPLYYAGGFQGGKTNEFIKAMKVMRANIEKDFNNNYVARWNDESHWNKYLSDSPPSIVLNPSYIYPDSLISEYYVKLWGRNFSPKIMTITKKFSINAQDGAKVREQLATM